MQADTDDVKVKKVYKRLIKLMEKQLLEDKFNLEECDILITNIYLNFLSNSLHNITDEKVSYLKFRLLTLSAGLDTVLEGHNLRDAVSDYFLNERKRRETTVETMH